jgi:hypothetical protein
LLLTAAATTALVLGYMVFWPWDKPPPEDADLRQLQLPPPCAPEDNAWPLLEKANKQLVDVVTIAIPPSKRVAGKKDTKRISWYYGGGLESTYYNPYAATRIWKADIVQEILKVNSTSLALLDEAAGKPGISYAAMKYPSARMDWTNLFFLLDLAAINEQLAGRHEEAAKLLLQQHRLGRLYFKNQDPDSYFEALSWMHNAQNRIAHLLQEPGLSAPVLARLAEGMPPLDQEQKSLGFKNLVRRDYGRLTMILQDSSRSKDWIGIRQTVPLPSWCFKPNLSHSRLADATRIVLAKSGRPYVKFAAGTFLPTGRPPIRTEMLSMLVSKNGLGDFAIKNQEWRTVYQWLNVCSTESHLSALRLIIACKRYQLKYGKPPDTLMALVPEFLDAIPVDPFDGKPFRYSPAGQVVYSVGANGIDDGGTGDPFPIWSARRGLDLTMPINLPVLPPITVPPLTEYIDQLREVPDNPSPF